MNDENWNGGVGFIEGRKELEQGVVISRECAEEAIDGFIEEINHNLPYRDRIADKECATYRKYDLRIKHSQSRIDEIKAALNKGEPK